MTAAAASSPLTRPSHAGSPAFRRFARWISTRCLRWYYRDSRVLHAERIPATGPVLFIGNHPNDLPDVLLGLLATERPLRYLATVSAATRGPARATYDGMGVFPVARIRDARKMQAAGVDVVAINRAATDAVAAALAGGHMVGAFPEGGVRDVPTLDHFRTGVASMLLKYLEASPTNDVLVVPFGLQYEAARTFGSDVVTVVGEPFSARGWEARHPDPASRGAGGLTRAMYDAVHAVTRNASSTEVAETRDRLLAAVAGRLHPRDPLAATAALVPQATAMAEAAHQAIRPPSAEAEAFVRCQTDGQRLAEAVARAGGIPTSAVDHARLLFALDVHTAAAPVPPMVLWLGLPAAALGWAVHGPLFWGIRAVARRTSTSRADFVAATFIPGLYVAAIWYLVVAVLGAVAAGAVGWSPWLALPALLLLPRFGDLAVAWRSWYLGWRLVRRAHQWSTPERQGLRDASARLAAAWHAWGSSAGEHD